MAAEVSVESGAAASPIVGRETIEGVYEEEDHRLRKRTKTREWEWFPISDPKYDFEYPVPKFGEERGYGSFNLEYDAQNNPRFLWPFPNGIKPREQDYVPFHKLLFTPQRNFLINNSGHQFDAAHLQGKILVILFLSLHIQSRTRTEHFTGVLRDVYTELRSQDISFEVVFVAEYYGRPQEQEQEQFDALFKLMPWLAIPCSDERARVICQHKFHYPSDVSPVSCFLLQTNGLIMHDWPAIFTIYGAKAFPFTSQRLEELENQNLSYVTHPPSMKELLGDSVISSQGDEVLSAHLENKVVGLFFPVDPIINTMLLSAWEELKDRHGEFEIVLVPRPYSEHSFTDSYGSLPWLSLSDTSSCQKLWWIYHPSKHQGFRSNSEEHPGVLVIIGPLHNRFCNYYAADILYKYGAEGYPFTLERAAELLEEKLEKLELGSLLGKEDLVCAADGKKLQRLVGWSRWMQDRFALDVEFI